MLSRTDILDTLSTILDPDIGINIVDLGLVENVDATAGRVSVGLLMTTPSCPQSGYLRDEAARLLLMRAEAGTEIDVEVLAAPFWSPERMSDDARAALGWR